MKPKDFQIGQVLWFVPRDSRMSRPHEVTVSSIGRKWVHISGRGSGRRFNPETMLIDGGEYTSPGAVYLSRDDHEREVELRMELRDFLNRMDRLRYSPPEGLTVERIRRAAKELGLA